MILRVTPAGPFAKSATRKTKKTKKMRTLTDHKLNGLNDALNILVLDEPGQGGACHHYAVSLSVPPDDPIGISPTVARTAWTIDFQEGPIKEALYNGLSGEALLAILIDRLRGFQAGPYACRDNAVALTHLEEALMWLQKRTRERLARGVEGTNQR
jgi:hypothetical protein